MEMEEKNCVMDDTLQLSNSTDVKDNNIKLNNDLQLNNTNSNDKEQTSLPADNTTAAGGLVDVTEGTEDCEMRNLDDYEPEPESSSLTTPVSSSDLEQTPRSSSEVEGGDGEKSEKNESIPNNNSHCSTSIITNNNNGPVHNYSATNLTKRSVTLQMLLAAGILKPGEGTMSLEYHGQKFMGDLLENGIIRSQETSQEFSSPSAWATACKQIINPDKNSRKSGCGWAAIKFRNLKLDYYKTVWFKRLREGSIDLKHITNGASSSSSDSEDESSFFTVLKFGEHFDKSPAYQSALQMGAKVLISCTEFKTIDRHQPFHVKISAEALALADLHCNLINSECLGYISGRWNLESNCLNMEVAHPSRILMPHSTPLECDLERNRIALDIQKLGHEVVGWYHSHPKAPPFPTKDDVNRQLDYQVMMKGASESSYIPCVGVIISPLCYTNQEGSKKSQVQLFWVMPPPENRPMEMGRPMNIEYDTYSESTFNPTKILLNMCALLNFYKEQKSQVDINDITVGRFDKLKETLGSLITQLKGNDEFWNELRELFRAPLPTPPAKCASPTLDLGRPVTPVASTSTVLNHTASSAVSNISSSPSSPETRNLESPTPSSSQMMETIETLSSNPSQIPNHEASPLPITKPEPEPMEVA